MLNPLLTQPEPSKPGANAQAAQAMKKRFFEAQSPQAQSPTNTKALGNYRFDVPYTAALKSNGNPLMANAHGLGSYRHDIKYTAALKSDLGANTQPSISTGFLHSQSTSPSASNHRHFSHRHFSPSQTYQQSTAVQPTAVQPTAVMENTPVSQAQGSYRHDIKYTAALKSSSTANAGVNAQQPSDMQAHGANSSAKQTSNTVKFAGANQVLAPVLFSVPFISTLSALNNANSMFAIAARDAFDSSGRVVEEFKRNRHGGRESFFEEFGTATIWAFGIPLSRKLYNNIVANLSKGGKSFNVQFPNLDPHLLEDRNSPHRLTPELVEKYFKNVGNIPAHEFAAQKKQLLELAQIPAKNGNGAKALDATAQKILNKYRGNQFLKLILCTFIPVLGIGFAIPKINQWFTHRIIHKERQDTLKALHRQELETNPFGDHTSNILRMSGQPLAVANILRMSGNMSAQTPAQPKPDIKFGGGVLPSASNWVGRLLTNDRAMSLDFVDTPLSSGRVITARNKDERIERLYREAWIIFTLFFLQTWLQQKVSNVMDKAFKTSSAIGFKPLKQLYDRYNAKGMAVQSGNEAFLADYAKLKQQLGVSGKLGDWIPDVAERQVNGLSRWKRGLNSLREAFTGYQPPLDLKPDDVRRQAHVLETIREYFSKPEAPANLLFDLSETAGHVPTIRKPASGKLAKGHIDITKKIDEQGVKTVAEYLDHTAETLAAKTLGKKSPNIAKALMSTNAVKASAFTAAAMMCWGVVSYFVPKTMHALTYLRTGKDDFPGVKGI